MRLLPCASHLLVVPDRVYKQGFVDAAPHRAAAWTPFREWASDWLRVERISSEGDIQRTYLELLDGNVDPAAGTVVEP
jgi:hypothetical protein